MSKNEEKNKGSPLRAMRSDIVVIGASAGGFHALLKLINELPADLPAAVFVVLHLQPERESVLAEIFRKNAKISVVPAKNGDEIKNGCVYVAVPDFHMRVDAKRVLLDHGPRHNFSRPAVDALFSSAAKTFGPRVIGIVLSGALDDGTAGLMDIKRNGGITVVQDPVDAVNPSMPASALDCVPIDHCLPHSKMGELLQKLAGKRVSASVVKKGKFMNKPSRPELSTHICPECNGPMWIVRDGKLLHFRCRIGHSFSGQSLLVEKSMALESALWSAVNALKDKADISKRLAKGAKETKPNGVLSEYYLNQASNSTSYAELITEVILGEANPVALRPKKNVKFPGEVNQSIPVNKSYLI